MKVKNPAASWLWPSTGRFARGAQTKVGNIRIHNKENQKLWERQISQTRSW
jgi:hypothetical protein